MYVLDIEVHAGYRKLTLLRVLMLPAAQLKRTNNSGKNGRKSFCFRLFLTENTVIQHSSKAFVQLLPSQQIDIYLL